jgi:hydrogenase nickel incorporation protein HypA/HybF
MHELGIAQSLLEAAIEHLRSSRFRRVTGMTVRIGELSTVDPGSLTFCFVELARRTPADGARIDVIEVPAKFKCRSCGRSYEGSPLQAGSCVSCGGGDVELIGGTELELVELQLE